MGGGLPFTIHAETIDAVTGKHGPGTGTLTGTAETRAEAIAKARSPGKWWFGVLVTDAYGQVIPKEEVTTGPKRQKRSRDADRLVGFHDWLGDHDRPTRCIRRAIKVIRQPDRIQEFRLQARSRRVVLGTCSHWLDCSSFQPFVPFGISQGHFLSFRE